VRGEFGGLVWASPAMNAVVDRARRLAPSRLPLVLTGPSGVGKTAFARAIHEASGRSGAFEVVDVPSVAGPRFAAEVFGAAAGAWTDGRRERIGAVVRADRGTLFLDEIAECPLADQARLLKVLEEQRVRPLGSERGLQVDVRIVVATREDLAARVRAGAFRSDLWHRLRGDVLALPSLQRRPGDVRLVAQRWLASHAPGRTLSPAAWDVLAARAWPGEVRELLHVLERAVALAAGPVVEVADLEDPSDTSLDRALDLGSPVRAVARSRGTSEGEVALRFAAAMTRAWARSGSQRAAARELGWSWSTWRTRRDAWGVGGPPTPGEEGS
jgi:DNA-binding NtrC family response regulator